MTTVLVVEDEMNIARLVRDYLRRAGFVETRQHGLWMFYELAPARSALHSKLLECLAVCARLLPEVKADVVRARGVRRSGGCCPEGRRLMERSRHVKG